MSAEDRARRDALSRIPDDLEVLEAVYAGTVLQIAALQEEWERLSDMDTPVPFRGNAIKKARDEWEDLVDTLNFLGERMNVLRQQKGSLNTPLPGLVLGKSLVEPTGYLFSPHDHPQNDMAQFVDHDLPEIGLGPREPGRFEEKNRLLRVRSPHTPLWDLAPCQGPKLFPRRRDDNRDSLDRRKL